MTKGIWVVRAGRNAVYVDDFLDAGVIAMGLSEQLGAECLNASRSELAAHFAKAHPDMSKAKVSSRASQLYRFLAEIKPGDRVATYDPNQRRYLLGTVGPDAPVYAQSVSEKLPYERVVHWTHRVPRDELSVAARNSLGAIQTIFRLKASVSTELAQRAVELGAPVEASPLPKPTSTSAKDTSLQDLRDEVRTKASEFIEDMIAGLDPYQMQDLVAGLLRAMGYKTRVSALGPDRGVDIFASPDGLGLEEPRIFVEVKHRLKTAMGSQALRTFMGGRQSGDRCLYVSTGGFTREARYEAERSNVPLTLVNLQDLGLLVTEHYDQLDTETRRLVPLTRLYWPASDD